MQLDSCNQILENLICILNFPVCTLPSKLEIMLSSGGSPHDEQWEKDPRETTVLISATSDSKEYQILNQNPELHRKKKKKSRF